MMMAIQWMPLKSIGNVERDKQNKLLSLKLFVFYCFSCSFGSVRASLRAHWRCEIDTPSSLVLDFRILLFEARRANAYLVIEARAPIWFWWTKVSSTLKLFVYSCSENITYVIQVQSRWLWCWICLSYLIIAFAFIEWSMTVLWNLQNLISYSMSDHRCFYSMINNSNRVFHVTIGFPLNDRRSMSPTIFIMTIIL